MLIVLNINCNCPFSHSLVQLNNEFVPLEIILLAKVADVDGVIRMLDAFKTNDGNFLIIMQRPEQVNFS